MPLLSCCAPLAEESRLLRDCYPPKKQLPSGPSSPSGPATSLEDYKPLSQELSKMTYFATNKPGKLNALARELETRVKKEAKETQAGYPKSRAMLLISLAILRSLLTECKRDLQLFAPSALRIIETAMGVALRGGALHSGRSGSVDLEVAVRAGSAFAAFATFADGASLMGAGADDDVGSSVYLRVLDQLAQLATSDNGSQAPTEKGDNELRNRTRLIGLASVSAACHSDVLFSSSSAEFESQIRTLIPALLQNLWLGSPDELERALAGAQLDDAASSSPYFRDFEAAARPGLANRRVPSLHAHVVGEKGPTTLDVVSASLGTLRDLLRGCYASQTGSVADVLIAWLDQSNRWTSNLQTCAWTWEALLSFSNLRYRYAFPLSIVDEIAKGDAREAALVSTLTSLLSAEKLSMPGLPTTKILHDLVNVIMRRAKERVDYSDIIKAAASLGVHIYYGEQVNDLVEVVISRIASVQSSAPHILPDGTVGEPARKAGSRSPSVTGSAEQREVVVIALIACIEAIMAATPSSQERPKRDGRGAVSLEVWQETLPLLCDGSRAVRAAYVKALSFYLRHELPLAAASANNTPPGTPKRWTSSTTSPLIRFLNALNATLYTLAVSSRLGYSGPATGPKTEAVLGERVTDSPQADSIAQGSATPEPRPATMGRRSSKLVALPMHRVGPDRTDAPLNDTVAGQADYQAIVETLVVLIQHDRVTSSYCCLPMLLALDKETSNGTSMAPERAKACKEIIVRAWKAALPQCTIDESALNPPTMIPRDPISHPSTSSFPPLNSSQATSWSSPPLVLADPASALQEDPQITSTFGTERSTLAEVFERSWSVQHALETSVEFFDNPHAVNNRLRAPSSARRLTGDIDASLRSFNTAGQRGIDVADLREALGGGKRSASSGGLKSATPSITHAANGNGSPHSPRSSLKSFGDNAGRRKLKPEDAREILKDIFRDKRRSAGPAQMSAI